MTLLSIDSLHLVESGVKNKGSDDGVRTWSTAVQILLPVAALAILWGRKGFFARFFLQFDKNCVSVFCPPFSKRQRLLKWASGRLPPTWSSHANTFPGGPIEFWRDGSLLCTLINSAIPGACPNPHRHWKRPPSHGQALAYKYLGIAPVFTETELLQKSLTLRHEGALINYLLQVQQAIARISLQELKYSSRYAARGMGLVAGEQHRRTAFYIYSSSTTSCSKHDVMVSIRGPYDTHCAATIPAYYISSTHIRNYGEDTKRLEFENKAQRSFLRTLSVDLGSFINVNQKPEIDNDMPIKLISESERVKVIFIPNTVGVHEISIITHGFHLVGSPFNVNVTENLSGVQDTLDESLKYPYRKNKTKSIRRKVISKIIDFIDEKISYENLNLKPVYERSIPKIKITQTKDNSQENCTGENSSTDKDISEDTTNENTERSDQVVLNNSISCPNLNFEECNLKTINDDATFNNFTIIDEEFKLVDTSKKNLTVGDNLFTITPNILDEFSNKALDVNVKFDSLNNGNAKIEQVKIDADFNAILLLPSNKYVNDDFNNNTIVVDSVSSPTTRDFPNKSNAQSTFTTSPICLDHIAEEVNDKSNASSEVPKWNFEKKRLRRQKNIDVSDISDADEQEEEIKDTITSTEILKNDLVNGELHDHRINKNQCESPNSNENPEHSLETHWKESEESIIDHQNSQLPPTTMNMYKCVVDEINENLEESHFGKCKNDFGARNQTSHNNIKSELEKDNIFSGSNPMNILNFLSSLKAEDSNSGNLRTVPKDKPENSSQENEVDHRINFKQRLQYWESQTNLHTSISNKRQELRLRRSLPNLLSSSGADLFEFLSQIEEKQNYKFQDNTEAGEFRSQFKERQEYWKALSSQNIEYSSISSSMYYLETLGKVKKHRIKARRSLPDLFSKVSRNEVLNEMSYRNLNFPIDFFDSPEAVKFKTKFQECRNFWERLSTQNLNFKDSYERIDIDTSTQENFDDGNFDSGFYSSLPNLSTRSQNGNTFGEHSDSLKFKRQYDERREYWEKLSLYSVSDLSLGENNKPEATYQDRNVLLGSNPVLMKSSNESQQKKLKTVNKSHEKSETNLDGPEENISRNDNHTSLRDKASTNLTDDLKHVNDRKEKMKKHFNQAKTFFKNLEESIK